MGFFEFVLLLLAIGALGILILGGMAWYGVRRLKNSTSIRRGIESSELQVRAMSHDPTVSQVASERLTLRKSMSATDRALTAAKEAKRPVGELPDIAKQLSASGTELDDDLRVIDNEPDAAVRHRLLNDMLADLKEHARLSAQLRRQLIATRPGGRDQSLVRAAEELQIEAEALRAASGSASTDYWDVSDKGRITGTVIDADTDDDEDASSSGNRRS